MRFKIEEVVTNYTNNALNHLDGERKVEIKGSSGRGLCESNRIEHRVLRFRKRISQSLE